MGNNQGCKWHYLIENGDACFSKLRETSSTFSEGRWQNPADKSFFNLEGASFNFSRINVEL